MCCSKWLRGTPSASVPLVRKKFIAVSKTDIKKYVSCTNGFPSISHGYDFSACKFHDHIHCYLPP